MRAIRVLKHGGLTAALLAAALMTAGCPVDPGTQTDYDEGYLAGFGDDEYYWNGYFDGWDTVDDSPVYWSGDEIPLVESPPYDAGYYDGLWYAYNDGYFTDYRYAFIIGFSEGYDNAYWPDYLDFLEADQHIEYRNGGWGDGYMDGYSEGRVFGAADYEGGLEFNWLDALLDYESGTDLYFEEIDVGTGSYGPVVLYEYGTDPLDLKKAVRKPVAGRVNPSIRVPKDIDPNDYPLFRPIASDAADELDVLPAMSLRSDVELGLDTTWLERIYEYLDATGQKSATAGVKAVPKAPHSDTVRPRAVKP